MPTYYNIHSHRQHNEDTDVLSIVNFAGDYKSSVGVQACSLGLHPWYLSNHNDDFVQIKALAVNSNVLAIGECGLDKVCKTDWALQTIVFELQIRLANELRKPLMVHCVRAFDEVSNLLIKTGSTVPVILHGYNKKIDIARKMINNGYYLSFGAALLNPTLPAAAVLSNISPDRYFLETDDAAVSIEQVYKKAAEIRNTDVDTIILQVRNNFHTVFKQL